MVYLIGTDEKEISESRETTVAPHLEDGIMIPCDRQRGRPRGNAPQIDSLNETFICSP